MIDKKILILFKKIPFMPAILGFLIGILINLSRWSEVGNSLFSNIVIDFSLAYVFNKCYILWREGTWKSLVNGKGTCIVLCGITFFNTIVVMYNKLIPEKMIYTDTLSSLFSGMFFYLLIFMTEISFIAVIQDFAKVQESKKNQIRSRGEVIRFCFITFGIMCAIWGLYLYATFPGVMTPDSFSQWNQAGGQQELTDWFPAFHTLVLRACRFIWNNPSSMIIFQIIFMAAIFTSGLLMFYKKGLSSKTLYTFTVIFAIIPANGIMMVNLQKDPPFMISFIWLVFLLMKFVWNNNEFINSWFNLLCLFFALSLTALFRHNGTYMIYGVIGALIIWSLIKKKYRLLLPAMLSLTAIVIITGPIYRVLKVPPTPKIFVNSSPMQDIAGVFMRGGYLSQETLSMMYEIMPFDYWEKRYNEYTSDTYWFPTDGDYAYPYYIEKVSNIPTLHLLRLYVDTFLHSPIDLVGSRIATTSLLWDIASPTHVTYRIWSSETMQEWENMYNVKGIEWHPNTLTNLFDSFADITSWRNPIFYFLLWGAGLPNAIILLLSYYWLINHKYINTIILVPFILNVGVLILAINAQDSRYIWPHIIFSYVLLIFTIVD